MKEIQISLTYEEIHWLEYLIMVSMEDFRDDPEKKQLYLQILHKFSASRSEDINVNPNQN